MYFSGNQLLLYAVTDRGWLKPGETLAQQVESALKGGVTMVQLREKDLPREPSFCSRPGSFFPCAAGSACR